MSPEIRAAVDALEAERLRPVPRAARFPDGPTARYMRERADDQAAPEEDEPTRLEAA